MSPRLLPCNCARLFLFVNETIYNSTLAIFLIILSQDNAKSQTATAGDTVISEHMSKILNHRLAIAYQQVLIVAL